MSQQKLFGSILVSGLNFEQFVENLLSNYVVMTTLSTWLAITERAFTTLASAVGACGLRLQTRW